MKTLIFLLLLISCSTKTESPLDNKIEYRFKVIGSGDVEAKTYMDGIYYNYYGQDSIDVKGSFNDTLRIYTSPSQFSLKIRLKIWVYGKLDYDKSSDHHAIQIHKGYN